MDGIRHLFATGFVEATTLLNTSHSDHRAMSKRDMATMSPCSYYRWRSGTACGG